jgi:hypothetical protein
LARKGQKVGATTPSLPSRAAASPRAAVAARQPAAMASHLGLHPVITFQYSSTTFCQFYYHIQSLVFLKRRSDITRLAPLREAGALDRADLGFG